MRLNELQSFNTEQEYRDSDSLNYSKLKTMVEDPMMLTKEPKDISGLPAIKIGSLVDTLLTDAENVDNIFHVGSVKEPTSQLLELAKYIVDNHISVNDHMFVDEKNNCLQSKILDKILSIANELGLWRSVKKEDKRIDKFDTNVFYDYLNYHIESNGKIVLSNEQRLIGERCAFILSSHDYTKDIICAQSDDRYEVIDQFKYEFKFNGATCKVMLDKIIVDHEKKIIYPYDIKTGSKSPEKFIENYEYFKYYIQAQLYLCAMFHIKDKYEFFNNYEVADFKFIYISTKEEYDYPMKYVHRIDSAEELEYGWTDESGVLHRGIIPLIDEYKWRMLNNTFNISKKTIDNKGEFIIKKYSL